MKILKYLLFLLLILIIAGSIYIATKDGDYEVDVARTIDAPAGLLFKEVSDLSNWQDWKAWTAVEGIDLDTGETTSGKGASLQWQAEQISDGMITTLSEIPNKEIQQRIIIETLTGEAEGTITWTFEPHGDQTRVTWNLEGSQSFKEKLAFTLEDENLTQMFSGVFQQALSDLESEVLRQMSEFSINVDGVTQHGGGYYMYSTTAAKTSEVNEKAAEMIQQVSLYMKDNNISISGKPFVVYNQRDEQNRTSIFSAAVPTPAQVITPVGSPVLNGYLEPQKVVKTTLRGHHKNASQAWDRAYRYIESNELQVDPQGQPFEIFITNPAEEENPASWVTEIYIPVL